MIITPELGKFNAGFQIIAAVPSASDEYVVTGESHTHADPAIDRVKFVTWRTWLHDMYSSYSNGNYFHAEHYGSPAEAKRAAITDMCNRAGIQARLQHT